MAATSRGPHDYRVRGPGDEAADDASAAPSEAPSPAVTPQGPPTGLDARGQRASHSSGWLAEQLSEKISEQVTRAVVASVENSMQACQSRLVWEVQLAIMKKLSENDQEGGMSTSNGPKAHVPLWPSFDWSMVDVCQSGRTTPRSRCRSPKGKREQLTTLEQLPDWVQKSVKDSGGIPSMSDLQSCHAGHVFAEQERQEKKRKSKNRAKSGAAAAATSPRSKNSSAAPSPTNSFASGLARMLRRGHSGTSNAGGAPSGAASQYAPSERTPPPASSPRFPRFIEGPHGLPPLLPGGPAPSRAAPSPPGGQPARAPPTWDSEGRRSFMSDDDSSCRELDERSCGGQSARQTKDEIVLSGMTCGDPQRQAGEPCGGNVSSASSSPSASGHASPSLKQKMRESLSRGARRVSPSCADDQQGPSTPSASDVELTAGAAAAAAAARGADDRQEQRGTSQSSTREPAVWARLKSFAGINTTTSMMSVEDVIGGEGPSAYVTRQILEGCDGQHIFNELVPADGSRGGAWAPCSEQGEGSSDDDDLSAEASGRDGSRPEEEPLKLRAWGVLPWYTDMTKTVMEDLKEESLVQTLQGVFCGPRVCPSIPAYLLMVASCSAFLFSLWQLTDVAKQFEDPNIDSTLVFLRALDFIVALGSFLSIPLMWRITKCKLAKYIDSLLKGFAQKETLADGWVNKCRHRIHVHLVLWLLCLTIRTLAETYMLQDNLWPAPIIDKRTVIFLRVAAFIFNSGILMATMHFLDYMCCVMVMMIDTFCFRCTQEALSVLKLVEDWNTLQALLRRAAGNCELSIMVLVGTISGGCVAAFLVPMQAEVEDARTLWVLGIVLPLAMVSGKVFMKAAEVSEKCQRVPSLVNSMTFKEGAENRFYLVHYISQSSAGFFLREVMINGLMVFKLGHLTLLASFAVLLRLLGKS